jgi:hypothetical protein
MNLRAELRDALVALQAVRNPDPADQPRRHNRPLARFRLGNDALFRTSEPAGLLRSELPYRL